MFAGSCGPGGRRISRSDGSGILFAMQGAACTDQEES